MIGKNEVRFLKELQRQLTTLPLSFTQASQIKDMYDEINLHIQKNTKE